jgi:hypothetical protein
MPEIPSEIIDLLREQVSLHHTAYQRSSGLCLLAKTQGWAGTHKWLGRFRNDQQKTVKNIQKFIADYSEEPISMPDLAEFKPDANSLPDYYRQVREMLTSAQAGWVAISTAATDCSCQDVDAYADSHMYELVRAIKKLNRFMNFFSSVGDDRSAWVQFDRERK